MENKIMTDGTAGALDELVDLVTLPEREPGEFTVREIAARLGEKGGAPVDLEAVRMRLERLVRRGLMIKRIAMADGEMRAVYRKAGE